jgi:2,5-dihydroxypyridine 5,6-dioxygenase
VNGTLVLDSGDVNLTFKRYLESAVTLRIENDYVVAIEGKGVDADLIRSYYASWNDKDAYAVSHVGWGMAPAARWDSMAMYDKRDTNGTELRAFAGNFLFFYRRESGGRPFLRLPFRLPNAQLYG